MPIEEDKITTMLNDSIFVTGDEEHKYYIQEGEQTAAMNFDREPRFYSTLGFDRGKWYGNSIKIIRIMTKIVYILKIVLANTLLYLIVALTLLVTGLKIGVY